MATNPYDRTTITGYNAAPPPDDGTQVASNQISWAGIRSKLTDLLKTAIESIDQAVANAFATNPVELVALKLDAGGASQTPLQLQAGTVNTTPVAGAVEFDGKAMYGSYATSQRGVIPLTQFICNASDVALTNGTSAQSPFDSANDVITVAGSTLYFFDALIYLTTGSTGHLVSFGFGGTATLTSVLYDARGYDLNLYDYSDKYGFQVVTTASQTVVLDAQTNTTAVMRLSGVIRINAAGTLIPQIAFTTAPAGTNLGKANSWFRLYPAGTDTVASVGNMA